MLCKPHLVHSRVTPHEILHPIPPNFLETLPADPARFCNVFHSSLFFCEIVDFSAKIANDLLLIVLYLELLKRDITLNEVL